MPEHNQENASTALRFGYVQTEKGSFRNRLKRDHFVMFKVFLAAILHELTKWGSCI